MAAEMAHTWGEGEEAMAEAGKWLGRWSGTRRVRGARRAKGWWPKATSAVSSPRAGPRRVASACSLAEGPRGRAWNLGGSTEGLEAVVVEVVAGLAEAYRGGGVSSTELGHGGLLRSRGGGAAEAGSEGEGAGEWRTRTRWRPSSEAGARARSVGARRCPAVAGRVVAIGPDTVAAGGVGPTCH